MSSGRTVLIVDDDPMVRMALEKIVESMGHAAIVSERTRRARRILDETHVDVMLLDLEMPDANGDLLLMARRRRNAPLPPTIVISGFLDRGRVDPLIHLGVEGIIAKPFHVQRVVEEVTRVLENRPAIDRSYCVRCGSAATQDDDHCRKCGKHLERRYTCPTCDSLHGSGARFCSQCGGHLGMSRFGSRSPGSKEELTATAAEGFDDNDLEDPLIG